MGAITADTLYRISYVPSWSEDGPVGYVTVRRLDDDAVVARHPAANGDDVREMVARAEAQLRGAAGDFEAGWGIAGADVADPGPSIVVSAAAGRGDTDHEDEPSDGERITHLDDRVTVLPDPGVVFDPDQPWLARVLHPLVALDLSAVESSLRGSLTLLSPVEPLDGLLGEATSAHHDPYANENWITFRLDETDRLRFLGARRYFEIEDVEARGQVLDDLSDAYATAETEIAGARARWARLGTLVWGDEHDPSRQRDGWGTDLALVDQLGGDPGYGNWTAFPPPGAYRLDESGQATPVLRIADGRPFTFVAATSGYPWRNSGADAILAFFEPETRTVALTFDWA